MPLSDELGKVKRFAAIAATSEPGNLPRNGVRLACGEQEACEIFFEQLAASVPKRFPHAESAANPKGGRLHEYFYQAW
jgi:hypothetical protein